VLQLPEPLEIRGGMSLGNASCRLVILRGKAAELPEASRHFGEHGTLPHYRHVLVEPRHAQARLAPDRAGIHRLIV
jgi:hypothetical protein